jgi:beta-lactamase class A
VRERLDAAWSDRLDGVDAQVSIALRSAFGPVAARAESAPHYAASTIKLAVLGAWLRQADPLGHPTPLRHPRERGDLLLPVHPDFDSAAGGRFTLLQSDDQDDGTWSVLGTAVDSGTLLARMIQVSGNLATDLLVEALGLDAVRDYVASVGLASSVRMNRLIGDQAAEDAGVTNTVTAAGLAELLAVLARDPVALGLLAGQQHRTLIPAGLPDRTWTANKSGWVPGVRHDVALVRPAGAPEYVLAVCASGLPDAEAEGLIVDLSRITYREWMQWHE